MVTSCVGVATKPSFCKTSGTLVSSIVEPGKRMDPPCCWNSFNCLLVQELTFFRLINLDFEAQLGWLRSGFLSDGDDRPVIVSHGYGYIGVCYCLRKVRLKIMELSHLPNDQSV